MNADTASSCSPATQGTTDTARLFFHGKFINLEVTLAAVSITPSEAKQRTYVIPAWT